MPTANSRSQLTGTKLPECEESANEAGPILEGSSSALPYEEEVDIQEALEKFRAYLSILREWDQKERLKADDPTD